LKPNGNISKTNTRCVSRNHLREESVRRFGLHLGVVGFELFHVLVATAIGIGLIVMFRDAVTSRSVVIDSLTESSDFPSL